MYDFSNTYLVLAVQILGKLGNSSISDVIIKVGLMSFIMSEFALSISIKFSKSQLSVNYAVDIPSLGIF